MFALVPVSGGVFRGLNDDEEARMPISHRPTQDFESFGTDVASMDIPIASNNVGYAPVLYTD